MAVFFTALTTSMTSCSDDDDDDNGGGGTTTSLFVPDKIVTSDNETFTFFYDDQQRVSKLVVEEDKDGGLYSFQYDAQGRITKVSNDWGSIEYDDNISYTYSGNTVTVVLTEQGTVQNTSVYTLDNNGLVTECTRNDGYSEDNITYKYDSSNRLIDRSGMGDYSMLVTYNNEVNGMCKDINASKFMAISLSDFDDFFDFFLTWDKSIAKVQFDEEDNSINTFTYTKVNSNKYPEVYKLSSDDGDEITYTITYKEIKK